MKVCSMVPLHDLIEVKYGKGLLAGDRDELGPYCVYGSNGVVGKHSARLIDRPTIVIGRKGSVGSVTHAPNGGWPIDTTFYIEIVQPARVELRYLYYALRLARLQRHTITTSIPGLNRDDIYRTPIPLPPLPEQRRIAAILDKADEIRKKRKEAIGLMDQFLQAAYLEVVGPDNPDHKNWPEMKVAELASPGRGSMRTGPFGSALRHSEFVESGIAVLGIDNAVQNRFAWDERRYITLEKYEKLKRYTVKPGDVIITIMGTTGRSAVVPDDIPLAITTKHLATVTVNRKIVEPAFLSHAIHRDPGILHQIGTANRGAIMAGLNLTIIKELSVRIPPLQNQARFKEVLEKIRTTQLSMEDLLHSTESLFQSLSQKAFTNNE